MKLSVVYASALLAGALCSAVQAKPLAMTCTFTSVQAGDWIAEKIVLKVDTAAGSVVISDRISDFFKVSPVTGAIAVDNAKRRTFAWTIAGKSNSGQRANVDYRLTVQKADGAAAISGTPRGYSNTFQGIGRCS